MLLNYRVVSAFLSRTVLFIASSMFVGSIFAQQAPTQEQLQQAQQASQSQRVDLSQYIQSGGNSTGRGGSINLPSDSGPMPAGEEGLPPPYGANLFKGGFETERSDGLNSSYLVAPGDKIAIQMWGTVNSSEVVTVDNQGNIFIPDIGPIKVQDVPASRVNSVVTQGIKSIYTNNVSVYVNLLTATPVSVFVAGPVLRPGQYAGLASDSVLFYLKRAGGIDPHRGSYRNITVMRQGETVLTYDLYDFLKMGKLPAFSFKDEDVIFVGEQGAMVNVEGAARYPFRFELEKSKRSGTALMNYARPLSKTSHVAITGNRESGPISVYLPVNEFDQFTMADGDTVLFNDDIRPQVISVQISGSYEGPSYYAVEKDTRLLDLLSYIEIDPEQANYGSIYVKRESVMEQQKMLINESLDRLERSLFTAPASSSGEASIRAQEAQLVSQFIARARRIEPLGKVIVSENGKVANIRLEQGDEIVIPAQTDLIQIAGEVLMPQAVVYNPEATVSDYIAWAGGFSERADDDRIAIVHANGITSFVSSDAGQHWYTDDENATLEAGDQILVLPKVDAKIMQSIKDVTQIIYQIAVAANAAS
ncbi:polysaccharide biosynthesis/export family protein [Aliiglaciecola lipolytica]|uniref:polysaccharide biosynthesis/export family protein n=1 Tax=Aliiglaciecola lipolytica TaxID=477689 RepID=UPI001C0A059A|nr:polysaccharide biosynthesis/export family protein [Aliiglaciecola lipolytica]MBU2877749.1 polysaccharide export protein [Aliiglaciecola lipolytica]